MVFEEIVVLSLPFADVLARVKEELAAEGFGTLSEIDVQATLKGAIDKDMDGYVIIGACNPTLAHRALEVEPQIGVLLPCNVVVRESDQKVMVEAMDPGVMSTIVGRKEIQPIAEEARRLIGNALGRLALAT